MPYARGPLQGKSFRVALNPENLGPDTPQGRAIHGEGGATIEGRFRHSADEIADRGVLHLRFLRLGFVQGQSCLPTASLQAQVYVPGLGCRRFVRRTERELLTPLEELDLRRQVGILHPAPFAPEKLFRPSTAHRSCPPSLFRHHFFGPYLSGTV